MARGEPRPPPAPDPVLPEEFCDAVDWIDNEFYECEGDGYWRGEGGVGGERLWACGFF